MGRKWCACMVLSLGLILGFVAVPSVADAQSQDPDCLEIETITALLNTRGYTFVCVPDNWNLYYVADESWYRGTQSLSSAQPEEQNVFVSQFQAGDYDDYVVGEPPDWQAGTTLQWQRDFAGVGYRSVANGQGETQVIPLFLLAMWAGGTLDAESLASALTEQADNYETTELSTLTLRYLDGEESVPPQVAYVLDGEQMQGLFNLDSAFLNSTYVIIQPNAASHSLTGVPVFAFFSSSPIAFAELESLLQNLQLRHQLPPVQPDPAKVANMHTPLGLLELVPELQTVAETLVTERRAEILEEAVTFAQEMPYTNLLPYQLLTSDANLYWAPLGLKTGRLILWHFTGGAHGNYAVTSWTFTDQGAPVTLMDLLAVSEEEALTLIKNAATEHLMNSPANITEEAIDNWVSTGLTELGNISAWNPIIFGGRTGLWITLEPYVITPYYMGIQEFFVSLLLQKPNQEEQDESD